MTVIFVSILGSLGHTAILNPCLSFQCTFVLRIPLFTHVEVQNRTMLGLHFFEPLCPCEDKMSIKKVFHFWPLEIAASMCDQSSLDGRYWPCTLAAISEGQKWNDAYFVST